jgi:hypothetical protein
MSKHGFELTEKGKAVIASDRVVAALEKFRIAQKAAREASLAFGAAKDELARELKDWGVVATIAGFDPTRMVQE